MRWVVLLLLAAGMVGCDRSRPAVQVSNPPVALAATDPANWMQQNIARLGSRTLPQLTLPASHDAAMYLTGFPQSLARTQRLSIYGQLNAGVRYFDLRPRASDGTFVLHHGSVAGPSLTEVLGDIRRYLREPHHELVLLKISHYEGFSAESYARFTRSVKDQLGPWLYSSLPAGKRLADVPLADYVRRGGAVLVLCDGQYPLQKPVPGIWIYRDWESRDPETGDLRVFDQYSNTMSYDTMQKDQLNKFAQYDGQCLRQPRIPCDLFLLSWTLTPPTGVVQFALRANSRLAEALQGVAIPNSFGQHINLLYADNVESAHLVDVALRLNRRAGEVGIQALH